MTRIVLKGLNGANPLGFMASVGLLRLLGERCGSARLGFTEDGAFHAWIECDSSLDVSSIADAVATDAAKAPAAGSDQPWWLAYEKGKKGENGGAKPVADLKPPRTKFAEFLASALSEWAEGRPERAEYAAAYGTDVALDGNKNTKPTAFHFTAAQQTFLGQVDSIRSAIDIEWTKESLDVPGATRKGGNLRWDPDAERSRALMSINPGGDSTVVNAPLEWLAFRALPTFRCVPIGERIVTCGVTGRRQDELRFHWPLWSCAASYMTVRSLVSVAAVWVENEEAIKRRIEECRKSGQQRQQPSESLQRDLERTIDSRRARGVFAVCTSAIRRTQRFGNFGPAHVQA
jgi:hypothetical protein